MNNPPVSAIVLTKKNDIISTLFPYYDKYMFTIVYDKNNDSTVISLVYEGNTYIKPVKGDLFRKLFDQIKSVMLLPYRSSTNYYYGDELQLINEDGKTVWSNVASPSCDQHYKRYYHRGNFSPTPVQQSHYDYITHLLNTVLITLFQSEMRNL